MPPPHRLIHVKFPANRGLPCVFNLFCRMMEEPCDYESYTPPDLAMIADADSYYKRPILDLVQVLESDPSIGVVSAHHSVEHPALSEFFVLTRNRRINVREKAIERGQCLLMRRADLNAIKLSPLNGSACSWSGSPGLWRVSCFAAPSDPVVRPPRWPPWRVPVC